MPDSPFLPLVAANPVADVSLCDLRSARDIVDLVVENAGVDAQSLLNAFNSGIVFSNTEPVGNDFGKVWVKTTGTPRGIGIVVDGAYVIIPIPADVEPPPSEIPQGGIILYGTGTPPDGWGSTGISGAPSGYQWIIKLAA